MESRTIHYLNRHLHLAALGLLALCGRSAAQEPAPPIWGFEVVGTYPHDRNAYCQGLFFENGSLYEGTGRYRQSSLRKVDLTSGKVLQAVRLSPKLFGEGVTALGDSIVQLTWRSQTGIVFDKKTLKHRGTFRYQGEGWGITTDGRHLFMSDGSAVLRVLDPATFQVVRRITVTSQGRQVEKLNELEYVEGEIYANVWGSDYIARISPETGKLLGWIKLTGLLKRWERLDPEAVLNGIAYDAKGKRLFVTGKLWPKLFEIRLVAPE